MALKLTAHRLLLPLLVSALLAVAPSATLRFDLQSGHTKCISEDIKVNAMAVGKYSVVNPSDPHPLPDSHRVTVQVTSLYGNSIHYSDQAEAGNFAFTASVAGTYLACFWMQDYKPAVTVALEFEWRTGVTAKDWSNVAKKGQIDEGVVQGEVPGGHCWGEVVRWMGLLASGEDGFL